MGKRLYVGNLAWDTTQDRLSSTFSANGRTVTDCEVVTDRETGRPRGFAFVEMSSEAEALSAIQVLNGSQLDGREIRVSEAAARKPGASMRDRSYTDDKGGSSQRGGVRW